MVLIKKQLWNWCLSLLPLEDLAAKSSYLEEKEKTQYPKGFALCSCCGLLLSHTANPLAVVSAIKETVIQRKWLLHWGWQWSKLFLSGQLPKCFSAIGPLDVRAEYGAIRQVPAPEFSCCCKTAILHHRTPHRQLSVALRASSEGKWFCMLLKKGAGNRRGPFPVGVLPSCGKSGVKREMECADVLLCGAQPVDVSKGPGRLLRVQLYCSLKQM